jgi:hypothetical protein
MSTPDDMFSSVAHCWYLDLIEVRTAGQTIIDCRKSLTYGTHSGVYHPRLSMQLGWTHFNPTYPYHRPHDFLVINNRLTDEARHDPARTPDSNRPGRQSDSRVLLLELVQCRV